MARNTLDTSAVVGALHDVANALTLVLAWAAEARAGDTTEEGRAHAIVMIEERARVARDLARRAIGVPPAEAEPDRALEAVVADVVAALDVEAKRRGVAIRVGAGGVSAAGARVSAAADFAQILTNLLLNALAFAPRGSTVAIDADVAPASVALDVQDEGPGIEAARASAIFEGDSTRAGGTGVGLQHSRAVARAEGGELSLVTPDRSTGARFRLTWPRAGAPIPPPPISTPRRATLSGTRVLVLEDDAEVATLLETALSARGAEVRVARSASELAIAAREPHDAALVDLSPIMDDVAGAVASIRRGSPNVAVVVISGSAVGVPDELLANDASGEPPLPALRWVKKPFEVAEIVAALEEARARGNADS